ncbi:MAG: hypothetical protein PCFJNLEI_00885 [Verrucomicrobiae bacterium]|nr:hypothetical protein [Verrucomicrobiae bacterium]
MSQPLVNDPANIRLAMLGMVAGNGHPYSWSAIINGRYDAAAIAGGGYPQINAYLQDQPLGLPGVRVTHVWCDQATDAERVARAAFIPHVVAAPDDVIGQVDAVVIATDWGHEHLERARPFIEAGVPVLIDKPLTDRADHLAQFVKWHRAGRAFLSTSCLRYAREFAAARAAGGEWRLLTMTTPKSWERYGIHALEGVYPFLRPGGWESVTNTGTATANIVHIRHADGADVVLAAIQELTGAFGQLSLYGTNETRHVAFRDTLFAFTAQLAAFVQYLRTGVSPVLFAETVELMKIIIAGSRSRTDGGRRVPVTEILCE